MWSAQCIEEENDVALLGAMQTLGLDSLSKTVYTHKDGFNQSLERRSVEEVELCPGMATVSALLTGQMH